jgi:hypothetical protein
MPCVYLPGPAPAVTVANIKGDDQTGSPTINKDLKFSKKSASLLLKLRDKEMKKE